MDQLLGSTPSADPQVQGVWKVTTPEDTEHEFAIVYLAGYSGTTDFEMDDFECEYRE